MVAIPLSLAYACAVALGQDPGPAHEDSVRIQVIARVGDDASPVRERVTERLEAVATNLGHPPDDAALNTLYVVVEWDDGDFLLKFAAAKGDGPLIRRGEVECNECTGAELLDAAAAHAPFVLDELFGSSEPALPAPAAAPAPVVPATTPPAPDNRLRRPLGAIGKAGIAAISVGAAVLATGGAFVGVGERRVVADPTQLRDFAPTGIGLLVGGVVAGVVGAVLLGVDRRRARQAGGARSRLGLGDIASAAERGTRVRNARSLPPGVRTTTP